jgi:predicted TIM-barrel fold metal-dependent hydrolase
VRVVADDYARRLGMSRREFLLSSMGAATTLLALAACSDDSSGGRSGGTYSVPPESSTDPDTATSVLDAGSPIVDVQTHLLEWDPADERRFGSGFPQAGCGDGRACFDTQHWMDEVFLRSDTTVAVLSAVPLVGDPDPLSEAVMSEARDRIGEVCASADGRVLIQGQAFPNVGPLDAALDAMSEASEQYELAAWKTYTHTRAAYRLDDDMGSALLERIRSLSSRAPAILCVHKGLGGDPADVGPAARDNPDIKFCTYHSGYERGVTEGPFDAENPNAGVDRLLVSLGQAGVAPGANVYAELGSTWRALMGSPDQAAHLLGKLLRAFGEDRILWGTDSIWYGSPQDQIRAMRAFQISAEFQDEYGYPELTDAIKEKILWRNAAELYGIDPSSVACHTSPEEREEARRVSPHGNATWGPTTAAAAASTFRRDHPWL